MFLVLGNTQANNQTLKNDEKKPAASDLSKNITSSRKPLFSANKVCFTSFIL